MHLYHASIIEYLRNKFTKPYAILFPRRLESLQKIMKIAHKYNIGVINKGILILNIFFVFNQYLRYRWI